MDYVKIALPVLLGVSLFWLMIRLVRTKQIKLVLGTSAVSGVLSLIAVCIIGHFQGELLHINPYTLGTASVLGIPGVIAMLAIKMLWAL